MRECRVPSAVGSVRRELGRRSPEASALPTDCATDGRVSLGVCGAHPFFPFGRRRYVVPKERACLRRVAWRDLHFARRRVVAELREPEAVLVDEVDGE